MSTKPTIDQQVMDLFDLVRSRQQAIQTSEKPQWKTTCTIGTSETTITDRINIQTVSDLGRLIDIHAFLLAKEDYWSKSQKALGIKMPLPFRWLGHSVSAWTADIQTRIAQIELTAKRAELKTQEARLDKLITTDQRRELELAAIQRELAGQ